MHNLKHAAISPVLRICLAGCLALAFQFPQTTASHQSPNFQPTANCAYYAYLPAVFRSGTQFYPGPGEQEPNNDYQHANGPLMPDMVYFGYPDDPADFYSIYLPNSGLIDIHVTNDVGRDPQVQLFYQHANNGDTPVAYSVVGPDFHVAYQGAAGWYYIFVFTAGNFNNAAPYNLRVSYPAQLQWPAAVRNALPPCIPIVQAGYDFEDDVENWAAAESSFKIATVAVVSDPVYSGYQALRLTTELSGQGAEVLQHTEIVGYFNSDIPDGMGGPGPYDLSGKAVSCRLFLPASLDSGGSPQAHIRFLVKDNAFRNQYGTYTDVNAGNVLQWIQLGIVVGQGGGMDPGFDPHSVNAMGVRVEVQQGSPFAFNGSLEIDHCSIENP